MPQMLRPVLASAVVLAALFSTACDTEPSSVAADKALTVEGARLLLPPPGRDTAAGYVTLGNRGDETLTVRGLSTEPYGRVEMHTMEHEDGMMRMREIASIDIAPGESASLEPHGRHLMFIAPNSAPQPGDTVDVVIEYTVAGARYRQRSAFAVEAR